MRSFSSVILTILLQFVIISSISAQKTWDGGAGSNNWNDGANWNPDGVPIVTDIVQIGSGYALVVDNNATCASITFLSNAANTSITVNTGITLNVAGNITYNNPSAGNISQTLNVGDGTLTCANISLTNTTDATRLNNLLLNNGNINVTTDIIRAGAVNENYITVAGTGIINIGGTFGSGATFTAGSGTVNFNGAGNQNIPAYSFYHLITSTGGTKTLTANTNILGDLTVNSSSSFNPNTFNLNVTGSSAISGIFADGNATGTTILQNVNLSGGSIDGGAIGIVNINGNLTLPTADGIIGRVALSVSGPLNISSGRSLNINNVNGNKTFSNNVTVDGTWNNSGNATITIGGDLTVNNTSTFAAGTGTYTFSGTGKTLGGSTAGISFAAIAVAGSLTNNITCSNTGLSGTGSWTQAVNSVCNTSGNITITSFTASASGNMVNYNGAGAQNVFPTAYYNLSATGGNTKTQTGDVTISNDLLIGTFTSLNQNTFNLSVSGNTIIQGTLADGNTTGTTTFQNVDLSGGTINGGANGVVNINGNLSLPVGDATIGRAVLTVNGTINIPAGRSFIINNVNGNKVFNNIITVDGIWNNSGNVPISLGGDLTVNNTAIYTAGTGAYTFTGTGKSIGGTIGSLSFPAIVVNGSITNNLSCSVTGLSGTGSWTQAVNSTLNTTGNITIISFIANASGNLVNYNSAGAQNIFTTDYFNLQASGGNIKTQLANLNLTNNLIVSVGTTFNIGTVATGLNIGGESQIDGILLFNGTTTKNVTITGNLSGSGTINVSGGNLPHSLNLNGSSNAITSFINGTGASVVNYVRNGDQTVFGTTAYRLLTFSGSGVKALSGNATVADLITISGGTFILNSFTLTTSQNININAGATLAVNNNARLLVSNTRTITNNGTFRVLGIAGNNAEVSINGAGSYYYNQPGASATLEANYYLFGNLNNGLNIIAGAISTSNNLSNGTFTSGTGTQYINLTGIDLAAFPDISNITFNTGPTYNINRPSGNGALTLTDAAGAISGENYDNDNGNPGTLINWNYPATTYYSTGNVSAGLLTSWTRNQDGTGANPPSITNGLTTLVVQDGHTVTVDNNGDMDVLNLQVGEGSSGTLRIGADATQRSVTVRELLNIRNGATFNAGSAGSPAHRLLIYGNINNDGTFNLRPSAASVVNTEIFGSTIIQGTVSPVFNDLTFKTACIAIARVSLDINGNVFLENTSSFNDFGLTHNVAGNWSVTGTGSYVSSGTIIFDGLVNTINDNPSGTSVTFNNITFQGNGAATAQENLIVNNNLNVNGSTILTIANNSVIINGNFGVAASSTYNHTANTTTFAGTGLQNIDIAGTVTFYNLNFTNGGANAKTVNGNLTVSNQLTIFSGSTVNGNGSHTISNGLRIDGTCGFSGTVTLKGGNLSTNNASNNLTLGTSQLVIDGAVGLSYAAPALSLQANINNDVNIISGYLVVNNNTSLVGLPGFTLSLTGTNSLYIRGTNNFPTGFGTYDLSPTSWVRYDVALDQTIRGGLTYGNLLLQGTTNIKTVDGSLDVNGILDLNSVNLNLLNYPHMFAGNIDNLTNSSITGPSSTVSLDAADANQTIQSSGTGSYSFNNLNITLNAAILSRTKTFDAGSTISINGGDLTLSNAGGSDAIKLIVDLNNNGIGGGPTNITVGSYCQINTDHTDFGTAVTDNFTGIRNFDVNSTVYYNLTGAQTIANGFSYGNITFYTGDKTARGILDINGSISSQGGTPVFYDNGFTHTIAGDWLLNNGAFYTQTSATGTIILDGSNQTINGVNFNHLTVANSGTANVVNNLTVFGNLTINAGAKIDVSTRNINLAGNFQTIGNGLFTQTTGITTFNGLNNQTIQSNSVSYLGNMVINKPNAAGAQTVQSLGELHIAGYTTLSQNAGVFDISNQNVYFGGSLYIETNTVETGNTLISTGSNAIFDGSDAQNIRNRNTNPLVFNNVLFTGAGDKTLDMDAAGSRIMDVNGNFTISGSTVSAGGWGYGGMDIYVYRNWNNSGSFTHNNARTVYFDGANQTISTSEFWNVDFTGTNQKTLLGNITVNSNLTITSDTLNANNYNISVDGNWTNTAPSGIFIPTNSTVTFNGAGSIIFTGAIGPTAGKSFYNVEINKNAATASLGGDLDVNNNLIINSGNLQTNAFSIWCAGNFNNNGGAFVHNNNASILTLDATGGNKIFKTNNSGFRGIIIDAPGAVYTVQDNFNITNVDFIVNNGDFILNKNTMTVNSANRAIRINGGSFVVDSASVVDFTANTQTINLSGGLFKLVGSEIKPATLTRTTGTFAVNQSGGTIHAQNYIVRNGNIFITGGNIDVTNNFSNGTFASGAGNAYLTLTGINFTDFNVENIFFNSGPTYNISRTSGTGTLTIEDASGAIAGENYDQDNAIPGTLINWTFPSGFFWDGGAGTDNWHDANNWSGNTVPADSNIVYLNHDYVAGAYTVKVRTNNASVKRIMMDAGGTNAITLVQESGYDVKIAEHLQVGTLCTYSLTDNTTVLNVGKNWTNQGTFNHGNSTVTFDGPAGTFTIATGGAGAGKKFYNLIINSAGAIYNLGNAADIDNNVNITNGTFNLASGNNDITVGGNWTINAISGGIFNASTADVTFDGTNQSITNGTFYNFLTAGSGTKTINSNIDIDADITIGSSTTLNGLENSIYIGDDWTNNGAFSQTGMGTIIFDGTGNQDISLGTSATTFHNVTFINGGNKTFFNSANSTGTVTINNNSGVVNIDTYTLTGVGTDNYLTSFGTLELRGANNFPSGFENILLSNTSNVIYRADINQTVFPTTYGNLTLRRLGTATTTKTAGGNFDITGSLNMNNDNTTIFNTSTNNAYIKLTGTININAGCDIVWGTGSSTLEHVGADWAIDADILDFNHLILNGTGDKYTQGDLTITGNLSVKSTIDLFMFQAYNRALFHTITGTAGKTFTLENSARLFCATPSATSAAAPLGFSNYVIDDNSSYYLYSPDGVDQTVYTGSSIHYGNLTFSGVKNVTLDGIADLDVNGELNTSYATLSDNNRNIKVAGPNIYLNYYTPSSSSVIFTLDGLQNQYLRGDIENNIDFGEICFTGSGIKTFGDGNDAVSIAGNLLIAPAVRATTGRNVAFSGQTWTNNGIYTHTGNTLTFNGLADQSINPGISNALNYFSNVAFTNAPVKSFISNGADINGNFTINSGTVDMGNVSHTINGQLTNNTGGTLTSANSNIAFDGGNQNINTPAFAVNNVNISGTGTKRLFSDWTINGNLIINSGTALNTSDNVVPTFSNIFIKGYWTNLGTYTNNTSTVTFNGATGPINITSGGSNFYNVIFSPTANVSYLLQSPVTRFSRSMNLSANSTLNLTSKNLVLGSNLGSGKLFTVDGTLNINEDGYLQFNNQGSQSIMNVSGTLRTVGTSSSSVATITREVAGIAGSETQINILSGGNFHARYYLIEYLQDAGLNLQLGSNLDAANNLSNGTWSNIRNVANVRYLTLESNYSGGIIRNVTFNYSGTPVQGTHFNILRELAATPVTFDTVGGNLGSYKFENDEEAAPAAATGLLRWPAVTETYWTGAVSSDWHVAGNWDNGVPNITLDAIIPDRANDPIIYNGNADCKNLLLTTGTLILDNARTLNTKGDITIGTGTNMAVLSVATPSSTIYAGGLWTRGTNGIFLHGNGTVVFNSGAGSSTIIPRNSTFNNVVFDNSLTTFYLSGTPINFNGNFEVLNGSVTPATNNYVYNIAGDISLSGGTFTPVSGAVTAGTIILNGSSDQTITNGTFYNLQVSGTGNKIFDNPTSILGNTVINSTMTASAGCNIDFEGNVTINAAGTFNDGNENHTFTGTNWTGTGTYAGNGTITFDRTVSSQNVYKSTFNNLVVNCQGRILTVRDSITINNDLTIINGTNYVNLQAEVLMNPSSSGSFIMEDNTRLYVYGDDNFPQLFASYNLSPSSYVFYYGSSDQDIAGITYGNLYLNNINTKTLKGDIEIAGNLVFNNSDLDVSNNNYTITLSGGWNNNNNGNFICRNGEVIFNGGINQAITFGGTSVNTFYDLSVNKTAGYAYANNNTTNDFIVQNNLNVTGGEFHANGRDIYIGNNMTASGSGTFYSNTGTYILNKTTGSALIATNGSSLLNLTVNSSGNATFTLQDDMILVGDLNITAGVFNGNGKDIILGNGLTDIVNILGTYIVGAGGSMALGDGTTVTVATGGRIEIIGTPASIARISRNASGGRYSFIVNGAIAAQYYMFEFMSAAGIYLSNTSTIDPTYHFSYGTYTQGAGSGQLLRVENTQSFTGVNAITDVSFPINPGGSASNVTKITATTGILEFYNSTGTFAGENYDNDPSNIINWTGPIVLTWIGTVSTDWNDSLNWSASYGPPIVPTGNEDVIIATATNQPILTTYGALTKNLTINNGASLTFNTPADGGLSDLSAGGDLLINGSLRLMNNTDYINVSGSWTRATTGTVVINGNVTFDGSGGAKVINNRGIPFYNLHISGTSQYQLGYNTVINHDLQIDAGSTFDVTPSNYTLTIKGNWLSNGTFMPNTGKVTFNAPSGIATINCGNSQFYDIDLDAVGVTYQMADQLSCNHNLNIISGTLDLNGNRLNAGDGSGVDNLTISGILNAGANSMINMGNGSRLNVNSGGIFTLTGTDNSNRATLTAQGASRYSADINIGGTINALYYYISNGDAEGLYLHAGAATSSLNNFSEGIFANGYPGSGNYLKIEHEPIWGNDTIKNVVFNSGPAYNVTRTTGTAIFYMQDASGPLGTYNYENDILSPDAGSGLLRWPFKNTYVWTGVIDSDWHKTGNWSSTIIPTSDKNAIIPTGVPHYPVISTGVAEAKSVTVETNAFLTISRNLTIAENMNYQGSITATGNPVINIGEDWTDNNGTFTPGNSTVILSSNSGIKDFQITTGSFYNLEIDAGGATYRLLRNLTIQNNLQISAGTLSLNTHDIFIGGNLTNNAAFNTGIQTVTFNGTAGNHNIDMGGSSLYNLTINSSLGLAGYRLTRNTTIGNNFTLTKGNFDLSPNSGTTSYNLTIGNRMTNTGGLFTAWDGEIRVGENWIISGSGIFNCGTSNVILTAATGTKTISPRNNSFYDITFNGNATFRLSGNMDVNSNLLITGGTLDVANTPSYNINLAGNWTNNGTFIPRAGTVIFDGISQSINKASSETFFGMNSSCSNLVLNADVNITNAFSLMAGHISAQTYKLKLGTGTSNIGSLSYNSGSISGKFERWLNTLETDYIFPVGTASNANLATIRFVSNLTSGSLVAEFIESTPGTSGLPVWDGSSPVDNVFTDGFWRLTALNLLASTDYNISLNGIGFISHTIDSTTRILKRNNSGNWNIDGTHNIPAVTICKRNGLNGISTTTTDFCLGIISCTGGTIGDADSVCEGSDLVPFINIASPTGGSSPSYTWQYATLLTAVPGDGNWTNIPASNTIALNYGTIATPTKFVRRTSSSGCPNTYSNAILIDTIRVPESGNIHHIPNTWP